MASPESRPAPETKETNGRHALISVSNKVGVDRFAKIVDSLGYKIISTGGTANFLQSLVPVIPIQEVTGNPESFDGRMKTISFQAESGILFDRQNPRHVQEARELGVRSIDLVICNLYPFEETVASPNVNMSEAIESIDVGGPTMVRAAAKNFKNVLVVTDPADYERVAEALTNNAVTLELRQELAAKAFDHLSFYDAQIARFLSKEKFPQEIALPGRKAYELRYGENPHQTAAVYLEPNNNSPMRNLQKITGRELSYVNLTDIAAGLESIRIFDEPAAVVIKHNSPSGIALGQGAAESLKRAVAADPESAFGGVIVLNKPLDIETATTFASFKEEAGVLIDIVTAPEITEEAKDFIANVRKTTGIYTLGEIPVKKSNSNHLRFFDGGFVIQQWDDEVDAEFEKWQVATDIAPTEQQLKQMRIAWKFLSRIRSNSVIVVDPNLPMTRGIGSGQTSRVRSTKIALEQANKYLKGAILASDSFFPFGDSVELAVEKGIGAIVQQGGSLRDKESIEAANRGGIPMIFTGRRAFWH
jgi:phosphoribosylaminoimidazolecarboxamide formyltransferase/IMP cyclohydrolase